MVNHDALFKILLTNFFVEFLDLFFVEVKPLLDRKSITFLDKEFFTSIPDDYRREADIVAKAKLADGEAYIIILVENQGSYEADFPQRLFFYVSFLHQREKLPIFPIVIFYGKRRKPIPATYRIEFAGPTILDFHYPVIHLSRLDWRQFINHANPLASALMAKMNIRAEDMPYAKLECLRIIATQRIDAKKTSILASFVESYLRLNAEQEKIFQQGLEQIAPKRKEKVMELMTSWEKKGLQKGLQQGREQGREQGIRQGALDMVVHLLKRQIRSIPVKEQKRLAALSVAQLKRLSNALSKFSDVNDLQLWLDKHSA